MFYRNNNETYNSDNQCCPEDNSEYNDSFTEYQPFCCPRADNRILNSQEPFFNAPIENYPMYLNPFEMNEFDHYPMNKNPYFMPPMHHRPHMHYVIHHHYFHNPMKY